MDKVTVPRSLLVLLGGGLCASLVALAFLLGRESARPTVVSSTSEPAAAPIVAAPGEGDERPPAREVENTWGAPPPRPMPPIPPPPPAPRPAWPSDPGALTLPTSEAAAPTPPAAPPPALPGPSPLLRAQVSTYFASVDRLQPGRLPEDGQGFAGSILKSALQGDTSGFDGFIGQAEASRRALEAIAPPAPCADYHRAALAMLGDSLAMLQTVRGALQSGDTAGLAAVAQRGTTLQARAHDLEAQQQAIRNAYNLR